MRFKSMLTRQLQLAVMALALGAGAVHAQTATQTAAPAASAPASSEISRAEHLVFTDRHLANIKSASTLKYDFRRSGSLDTAATDRFTLRLALLADGRCCRAEGGFDALDVGTALPPVDEAVSNPVVLYFLEQDIRAMQRRTKGQANYFRKRIRMALAEHAEVRNVTVQWRGQSLPAQEVHIKPYVDDPLRVRFEKLADKHYVFTIAAGVPGGIYDLRSWVPAAGDAADIAASPLAETLTLTDVAAGLNPSVKESK